MLMEAFRLHNVDHKLKDKQTQCKELKYTLFYKAYIYQPHFTKRPNWRNPLRETRNWGLTAVRCSCNCNDCSRDVTEDRKTFEKEHSQLLSQLLQRKDEPKNAKIKECDRQRNVEATEVLKSQLRELEKKCELQKVKHEELVLEMDALQRKQLRKEIDVDEITESFLSNGIPSSRDVVGYEIRSRTNTQSPTNSEGQSTLKRTSPLPRMNEIPSEIDRIMAKLEQDNKILAELDRTRASIGLGAPVPAPRSIGAVETGVIGGFPRNHSSTTTTITTTSSTTTTFNQSSLPTTTSTAASNTVSPMPNKSTNTSDTVSQPVIVSTLASDQEGKGAHCSHHEASTSHEDPNEYINISGIGLVKVYAARYTYDPFQMSPNENPEAELMVNAGDYVLVATAADEDGFLDGQLLDGRRGLVPSNFVDKLTGEDLLEFQQHLIMDESLMIDFCLDPMIEDQQRLIESCLPGDVICLSNLDNLEDTDEFLIESSGDGPEIFFSTLVAPPHNLTLERQFRKSILISWAAPNTPLGSLDSFNVYVDGELRVTVLASERTRALVEGVDSTRPHRISVRSVTPNRRMSVDAACTIIIGKDVPVAPTCVRASSITSTSAIISWLPSNSNYQHVVCVNSVEVRMLKPGIYRHTITGLSPNTTYRVTVKVKNIKPSDDKAVHRLLQVSSTSVDFRTLPKGLPDPPLDVQVEPGPQDGTLLITWLPVMGSVAGTSNGSQVTGYSVYADGKKVVDIESPTGDHALLEVTKLVTTPKHVTVRTKSGESVSADSAQVQVPNAMLKRSKAISGELNKMAATLIVGDSEEEEGEGEESSEQSELSDIVEEAEEDAKIQHMSRQQDMRMKQQARGIPGGSGKEWQKKPNEIINSRPNKMDISKGRKEISTVKMSGGTKTPTTGRVHGDSRRMAGTSSASSTQRRQDSLGQTVIDTEDNLSDKEVYPSQHHVAIPAIEITKDSASEGRNSMDYSDEDYLGQRRDRRGGGRGRVGQRGGHDPRIAVASGSGGPMKKPSGGGPSGHHHHPSSSHSQPPRSVRTFIALFDYDPKTMSPNPGAFMEELSFRESQLIKIHGDKDPDGFYWGEVGGRQGYVPCNMVSQVHGHENDEPIRRAVPPPRREPGYRGQAGAPKPGRSMDRWNDDYDAVPVKKMIALYDYDPQELSPNVDADVELSFNTGDIIYVYGDMDEDGFFMGEMNGVRGLVPSNFLAEAPPDYPEEGRRHPPGPGPGPGPLPEPHGAAGGRGYDAAGSVRRTPHPADPAKYNYHPRPGSQPPPPQPPQQRW
ncbi:hypothetical protein CHUAL_011144 [Chamberlinius hualienensis]